MDDYELRVTGLRTLERAGFTLDTLAMLHRHNHGLCAYCTSCARWADLDLARLVREGHGRRKLVGFKPRCRACGMPGQIQVRPPVPPWGGATWGVHPTARIPGPHSRDPPIR